MMKKLLLILVISIFVFASCSKKAKMEKDSSKTEHKKETSHKDEKHSKIHWGYKGQEGPEYWGSLSPDYIECKAGMEQSPIDLKNAKEAGDLMPIESKYPKITLDVVNNGHSIVVNYKKDNKVNFNGKEFKLLQFHFHSLSEHTLNGEYFPMEIHFVHKADDGSLAVIGVFIKEGKENPIIQKIWDNMPVEAGKNNQSSSKIDINNLFPKKRSYFHYTGSLTTPPCSEGVSWFVYSDHIEVSKDQVEEFVQVMEGKNNRPVQAVNERSLHYKK